MSAGGSRQVGTLTREAALVAGLLAPPRAAPEHGLGLHRVHLPVACVVEGSRKPGRREAFTVQRPGLTAVHPLRLALAMLPPQTESPITLSSQPSRWRLGGGRETSRGARHPGTSGSGCLQHPGPGAPTPSPTPAQLHAGIWRASRPHRDSLEGSRAVTLDVPSQGANLAPGMAPEVPGAGLAVLRWHLFRPRLSPRQHTRRRTAGPSRSVQGTPDPTQERRTTPGRQGDQKAGDGARVCSAEGSRGRGLPQGGRPGPTACSCSDGWVWPHRG